MTIVLPAVLYDKWVNNETEGVILNIENDAGELKVEILPPKLAGQLRIDETQIEIQQYKITELVSCGSLEGIVDWKNLKCAVGKEAKV
jgi:hypothetical protein